MSIFEQLWQGRRLSYPRGAHIPTSEFTAARRGSMQQREEFNAQRRMSVQRPSIARGTLMDHYARRRISSVSGQGRQGSSEAGMDRAGILEEEEFEEEEEKEDDHIDVEKLHVPEPPTPKNGKERGERTASQISLDERRLQINPIGKPYPIPIANEFHKIIFDFTESKTFSGFILFIILTNTGMLISSTFNVINVRAGWYFAALDNVFLGIYIMEIVLKLYAWRGKFFSQGWNNMDFTIVVFNTIDFAMPLLIQNMGSFNGAAIFRILRIFRAVRAIRALRVLRTIRFLSNLQVIMTTILQSIRSIGAIVLLISLFMYMFAVIGRGLYAEVDSIRFGNLFSAFFTLFQLLTLDDWYEIYKTVTDKDPSKWHIVLFLLTYIVVEYFVFLNLFVAVLVDNFQLTLEAQNKNRKKNVEDSDDEDEFVAPSIVTESISSSESEEEKVYHRPINEQYPGKPLRELDKLSAYFQLLASIEHNEYVLTEQQRILNMMVDLCVETNDDI